MKRRRWIIGVVGGVILLNVLGSLVASLSGAPTGPPSSSYATTPRGLAAYAELLTRFGHPVQELRRPLEESRLDPKTTVLLMDPGRLPPEALEQLAAFVRAGGRLVGSEAGSGWTNDMDGVPAWSATGAEVVGASKLDGIREVTTASEGTWKGAGSAEVLLGEPSRPHTIATTEGAGSAVFLADSSPLQNRLLAQADNAGYGLLLAGEEGRPVVFVESVHGYGLGSGLAAIPDRWRWASAGLALAAAVYAFAKGRRLGPPEESSRELPPARTAYVEALAATLARVGGKGGGSR